MMMMIITITNYCKYNLFSTNNLIEQMIARNYRKNLKDVNRDEVKAHEDENKMIMMRALMSVLLI